MTAIEAKLLSDLRALAEATSRFAGVNTVVDRLVCTALDSSAPAEYRVWRVGEEWRVALFTPDRWLSESIESELVESRETFEDLLGEELRDLDWAEPVTAIRHFRDDNRQYVFETSLPSRNEQGEVARVATFLAGFERTFSQLGDMSAGQDNQ